MDTPTQTSASLLARLGGEVLKMLADEVAALDPTA